MGSNRSAVLLERLDLPFAVTPNHQDIDGNTGGDDFLVSRDRSLELKEHLWMTALEAERRAVPAGSLSNLWEEHALGGLRVCFEFTDSNRILLVAHKRSGQPLPRGDMRMLLRVLGGEQQKVVALELQVAVSTISSRYSRSLAKLGVARREVPVPLVLAAQCSTGAASHVSARMASFGHRGGHWLVVSVPKPATQQFTMLTHAQREVAASIIEGCSRFEIARHRGTSIHTTSRQVHSVFAALKLTGRYALIRRALELGCFRGSSA
jgi:DNA-binding NarL/FixJ family response regulator